MKLMILAVSVLTLSGCAPVGIATSVGAVGGIASAREGGIQQSAVDARIKLEINELWFKYDVEAFRKLSMTVEQGRVLVTGVVQNPDHRVEAIRLAWQPKGVKQVINEVQLAKSDGIQGYARDSWISTQLRTKLIFDKDIQSINYTIDAVKGIVYLMGVAQDRAELNKVIEHARTTSYVRQVISYVKFAGDPVDSMGEPIMVESSAEMEQSPVYRTAPSSPASLAPASTYSSSSQYSSTYSSSPEPRSPNSPAPVESMPLNSGY